MATFEMVEKLRGTVNVSYDEAKAALEACGDDMLEAVIYLERMGKVAPPPSGGYYSTNEPPQQPANVTLHPGYKQNEDKFGKFIRRIWDFIANLIDKGNKNNFNVWKGGNRRLSVPITVLVVLTVFCFWVVVPLLIIGLFLGCSYRFSGPELDDSGVNNVMETAARAADTLKNEVRSAADEKRKP